MLLVLCTLIPKKLFQLVVKLVMFLLGLKNKVASFSSKLVYCPLSNVSDMYFTLEC